MLSKLDHQNYETLNIKIRERFSSQQWKRWKCLCGRLRKASKEERPLEIISTMNGLLAEKFNVKGLGGDLTFEELLHTYICLTLRKNKKQKVARNDDMIDFLRDRFDKPYHTLDHFSQAFFQYDARDFIKVQGVIVPREEKLLDNFTVRILVTGDYILSIQTDAEKSGTRPKEATLLFAYGVLPQVIIPEEIAGYKITELSDYLFYCQRNLTELQIPQSVKKIGAYACAYCDSLLSLIRYKNTFKKRIPIKWDSTIELEKSTVFIECDHLVNVPEGFPLKELEIPHQRWPYHFFTNINIPNHYYDKKYYDRKRITDYISLTSGAFKAATECQRIGVAAFRGSPISHFEGNEQLVHIAPYAFRECEGLKKCDLSKTKLERIEFATFSRCTKLEILKLPLTLRYISPSAFHMCKNLRDIKFGKAEESSNEYFRIKDEILYTSGMRTLIKSLKADITEEDLCNTTVVHIVGNTFPFPKLPEEKKKDENNQSQIQIPDGITYIGEHFLEESKLFNTIKLPKTLMGIAQCAFSADIQLDVDPKNPFYKTERSLLIYRSKCVVHVYKKSVSKEPSLDKITKIKGGAFKSVPIEKIKDVGDLEVIEHYAFEDNPEKSKPTEDCFFPFKEAKSLEFIGRFAFAKCKNIKKLDFNDQLRILESNAFENCTSLKEITFGKKIQVIGENCYKDCSALETINFSKVKKVVIQKGAFPHDERIEVTLMNNPKLQTFDDKGKSHFYKEKNKIKSKILETSDCSYLILSSFRLIDFFNTFIFSRLNPLSPILTLCHISIINLSDSLLNTFIPVLAFGFSIRFSDCDIS